MNKNPQKSDTIADSFRIRGRFLRSINIQRDFEDSDALDGYVPTDLASSVAQRMAAGLKPDSGQRAWRLTGDYGSGKSSFALLLAHALAGRDSELPPQLRRVVDFDKAGIPPQNLVPILITGKREPVALTIVRALKECLTSLFTRGRKPEILQLVEAFLSNQSDITDDVALELLCDVRSKIIQQGKGDGILLIIDELGKFLEFAVQQPEKQDIYFFQRLAETACRSKKEPLFVVGLLHQGFNAYAEQLSQSAQREWAKVAERFDEIIFNQPLDQIATLVGCALGVNQDALPRGVQSISRDEMKATLDLGWFGFGTARKYLVDQSPGIYPLHPTVLPVLVKIFSRLGQNERSLFSFLLSNEPFGLQSFAQCPTQGMPFYRLDSLYDYVRSTFGHRLNLQSYRTHWSLIESVIDAYPSQDALEVAVLKSVGLLNLLSPSEFTPSAEALALALGGCEPEKAKAVKKVLQKLQQTGGVLYNRGPAGYSLWPYTSVDLDQRRKDAAAEVGTINKVGRAIEDYLDVQPIVARRHYIETGNLRHFDVHYCATSELLRFLDMPSGEADGRIIVPLCENEEERGVAIEFAKRQELQDQRLTLTAIPRPLQNVGGLVEQLKIWEWVAVNTPELNGDALARQEVSRQLLHHRRALREAVERYVGLRSLTGPLSLQWFRGGKRIVIPTGRQLLSTLSKLCDEEYAQAPRVRHELVNRRSLSSAGASARQRLIERIFESPGEPSLGMDPTKAPPEMSMYLSVLRKAGLHRETDGVWSITLPGSDDAERCFVSPTFDAMMAALRAQRDARIRVSDLFAKLGEPPLGVREGLIPLLFAVFAAVHRNQLAFYDNGTFLREVRGEEFRLLIKQPEAFEVQYFHIEGMRGDLFARMLTILRPGEHRSERSELLDVVRPLCAMVAQLAPYVHNTSRLSTEATAVRRVVLAARDPIALLFHDLPVAVGFKLEAIERGKHTEFVAAVKGALDELRAAYPSLQSRMETLIRSTLNLPDTNEDWRKLAIERAERLLLHVGEQDLKSFCARLSDANLPTQQWIEAVGGYLVSKPPAKWTDDNEAAFAQRLAEMAGRFVRVESTVFKNGKRPRDAAGIRLAVTRSDGLECQDILYFTPDEEEELSRLEREVTAALAQNKRLGLVAASRAIWEALNKGKK